MTAVPASASDLSRYSNAKDHVAMFQKILGEHNVVSDSFDMEKYCYDWKRNYFGGSLVVTPVSSDQVQEVMRYCSAHQIGVVVQGGNTGLVGGAVGTNRGELVLSMEKMNKVISIDADSATVICEAGCILENLNSAVEELGFMIPLDLGPKGSCQIGGNISTNAGGLRVVRYGSLQTNVLGLEVIQANGDKLDMLRTLYKDNTGYHLKHLFIGAEGTLGVVTKIALRLAVTPKSSAVVFSKIPNFQAIPKVLRIARAVLGANLSAFEFIDSRTISAIRQAAPHLLHRVADTVLPEPDHDVLQKHPELKVTPSNPEFGIPGEVSLLVEATGTDPQTDSMKLEKFVSSIMEENLVIDAVMAQDKTQETGLWLVREQCAVALIDLSRRIIPFHDPKDNSGVHSMLEKVWCGYLFKFDLSLSLTAMPQVLQETMLALQAKGFHVLPAALHESSVVEKNHLYTTKLEFCNYGHVGDQNVHLNILMQTPCVVHEEKNVSASHSTESAKNFEVIAPMGINSDNAVMQFSDYAHAVHHVIDDILYAAVLRQRGSVSAEHGIGQEKKAALAMARSGPELMLMQAIKKSLDPNNILNPGKML
jgi:FAD/FMN-containing dehydrogenase